MIQRIKNFWFGIRLIVKKMVFQIYKINPKKHLHQKVKYFSQWESKDLVEQILKGEISAENDPLWKNSGAENKKEYLHWSHNGCGMACLKMILYKKLHKNISLVKLGKQCLDYGGYHLNKKAYENDDFLNSLPGMFYQPFKRFVEVEYGLKTRPVGVMAFKEAVYYLSKKRFVIASVSSAIRGKDSNRENGGAHLVLLLGYNLKNQAIFFHNPSGLPAESQVYVKESFHRFKQFFNNRGIIVY
jgi:hypothetical protein